MSPANEHEATVDPVPSKGGDVNFKDEDKKPSQEADGPSKKKESIEDMELRANLELLVSQAVSSGPGSDGKSSTVEFRTHVVVQLAEQIRGATASVTSIPKPLSILQPHFNRLVRAAEAAEKKGEEQAGLCVALYDVVSVLAMTYEKSEQTCLFFRLKADVSTAVGWGYQYIRHLQTEIAAEFEAKEEAGEGVEYLLPLAQLIVEHHLKNNAAPEACDLLLEIGQVPLLKLLVPEGTPREVVQRVVRYIVSCAEYVDVDDQKEIFEVSKDLLLSHKMATRALALSLQFKDYEAAREIFHGEKRAVTKKQMALILGRAHLFEVAQEMQTSVEEAGEDGEGAALCTEEELETLTPFINNGHLTELFKKLGETLDISAPKAVEDVYKTHLVEGESSEPADWKKFKGITDSWVSGLVNAGFQSDSLVTDASFLKSASAGGVVAGTAALGFLNLWDVDEAPNKMDKYLTSDNLHSQMGALLGLGVALSGVRENDFNPMHAFASDTLETLGSGAPPKKAGSDPMADPRIGALLGLGMSGCGSNSEEYLADIMTVLEDDAAPQSLVAIAGLAGGLICICCPEDGLIERIFSLLKDRPAHKTAEPVTQLLVLGLAFMFIGKGEDCSGVVEVLRALPVKELRDYAITTVESMAFAGTGNVLYMQKALQNAGGYLAKVHKEKGEEDDDEEESAGPAAASGAAAMTGASEGPEKKKGPSDEDGNPLTDDQIKIRDAFAPASQIATILGASVIASGEGLGAEMMQRFFPHFLQHGDDATKKAVPLALALLSASNPDLSMVDSLSRLSHDSNPEVATAAIFSLGILSAGSNHARVAQILRSLVSFHSRSSQHLFAIRLAQGLLYLGKGTLSVSPYYNHGHTLHPPALAGLMIMSVAASHPSLLFGQHHYLLSSVALAAYPRMVMLVDEDLQPMEGLTVRVGTAVDAVGQAGKPKTLTGFQVQESPAILSPEHRAEIADSRWKSVHPVMEGVVVVEKNPLYDGDVTTAYVEYDKKVAARKAAASGMDVEEED